MRDFTKEQNGRELSFFLLPIICSGVFRQVYSLINTAVVSRYLSYEAVAVIGACQGYVTLQNCLFVDVTMGFSFYIFRCIGRKEEEIFRQGVWGACYLTGLLSVFGAFLPCFSGNLMDVAHISPELQNGARAYLFFLFLGSGILGFKNLLFCIIQGMGDARTPGILSMAGVITQTGIVVFLVAVLHLGIAAPALAVLLNDALLSLILLICLLRDHPELSAGIFPGRIPAFIWEELLKNGFVRSQMKLLISFGVLVMQRAVNGLPKEMIAASAYVGTINGICLALLGAYGSAAGIITGQNEGSQNIINIKKYNRSLLRQAFCWSAVFLAFGFVSGSRIIELLAGTVAPEVTQAGAFGICMCAVGYPGLCLLVNLRNSLQAMGEYMILPWLGFAEMSVNVCMAPFVELYGYKMYYAAVVVRWCIPGIMAYIWYCRSVRKLERKWQVR